MPFLVIELGALGAVTVTVKDTEAEAQQAIADRKAAVLVEKGKPDAQRLSPVEVKRLYFISEVKDFS